MRQILTFAFLFETYRKRYDSFQSGAGLPYQRCLEYADYILCKKCGDLRLKGLSKQASIEDAWLVGYERLIFTYGINCNTKVILKYNNEKQILFSIKILILALTQPYEEEKKKQKTLRSHDITH